ncbi:MAG: hypothetical protein HQ568_07155 [Calditrichaeota bacterium]|nr:hypothetical protein [Calditrichota bacterium]
MQYCPKCGGEYTDEVDVCSDCEADLVAEQPPEIPEEYYEEEWVELHIFPGSLYAQMAVEMLNRDGIPAYSQSLFGLSGLGGSFGADSVGANATVWVLEPDLDRAEDIIEPMINEIPGSIDEDEWEM